jgi:hypothetical protein
VEGLRALKDRLASRLRSGSTPQAFPVEDGSHIHAATLNVNIALPQNDSPGTKRFEAIIDSGAPRCLFNADIGWSIGLNIASGDLEETMGVDNDSKT